MLYTTGEVAAELNVLEPALNDLIRRAKIAPAPSIRAGRRFWTDDDVARARAAVESQRERAARGGSSRA